MHPLEEKLGYRFRDPGLLDQALTHSSYANERLGGALDSNERLEFLGDSILGQVTAEHLYRAHPQLPEGDLTRMRAALVCEESLAQVAVEWGLGERLRLGRGEEQNGGRHRPSIQADAVEAILAAIYLDSGDLAQPSAVIHRFILSKEAQTGEGHDFKTALQELIQRTPGRSLKYQLVKEEGPDHLKEFWMEVTLDEEPIGLGRGHSKKEAEQQAARAALEKLRAR